MILPMVVVGALCESVVGLLWLRRRWWLSRASEVTGTVFAHDVQMDGNTASYAPIVEYSVEGEVHRYRSTMFGSGCPAIGSSITVFVDPADPTKALLASWSGTQVAYKVAASVGALVLLVGLMATPTTP